MSSNEFHLNVGGRTFTVNNNSNKFDRARIQAGKDASDDVVLAFYDKLAGLIKNEKGDVVENGAFWGWYSKWLEDRPEFNRLIEDRARSLTENENSLIGLYSMNIEHRRAMLGTQMTIAAAVIAGLFIFFATSDKAIDPQFLILARLGGYGYAMFLLYGCLWLAALLVAENTTLSDALKFLRQTRSEFFDAVGTTINDIKSYEEFRNSKFSDESKINRKNMFGGEGFFYLINGIFVLATGLLVIGFVFFL